MIGVEDVLEGVEGAGRAVSMERLVGRRLEEVSLSLLIQAGQTRFAWPEVGEIEEVRGEDDDFL